MSDCKILDLSLSYRANRLYLTTGFLNPNFIPYGELDSIWNNVTQIVNSVLTWSEIGNHAPSLWVWWRAIASQSEVIRDLMQY